ncbi:hypothetical protein BV25DRAFT_1922853 [Artomyces pyxidatus]|uniref:Uncharacterized protein n=1 Tax=Artomyces pyxidatus TaxID=48021 RepID=A0ACB8SE91_9AGAM|nr:hypothetical protein BV25DRAFT_1922853 [Artomyces pyxidatus]
MPASVFIIHSQEGLVESEHVFDTERDAWENDKKEEPVKVAEERSSREVVAHAGSIKVAEELKKHRAFLGSSSSVSRRYRRAPRRRCSGMGMSPLLLRPLSQSIDGWRDPHKPFAIFH